MKFLVKDITMHARCLTLALALALATGSAAAEDMGLYVGGSVGAASLALGGNYLDQEFSDIHVDDETSAWKGYAGVQFLPFISLEGGYTHFGQVDDTSPNVKAQLKADTLAVFARGSLPLGPIQLFGKLGYHFYDANVSITELADGLRSGGGENGQDIAIGAGAGFEVGAFTLRAEYEIFLVENIDDLSMISIGASYSF